MVFSFHTGTGYFRACTVTLDKNNLFFILCTCVHMAVTAHVCKYVCGSQRSMLGAFFSCSPPYFLDRVFQ